MMDLQEPKKAQKEKKIEYKINKKTRNNFFIKNSKRGKKLQPSFL